MLEHKVSPPGSKRCVARASLASQSYDPNECEEQVSQTRKQFAVETTNGLAPPGVRGRPCTRRLGAHERNLSKLVLF